MEIICKVIAFGSEQYWESVELRRDILRKPLGMDFTEEELKNENGQIHIGCYFDNQLVGIMLLIWLDQVSVKMRQVAVKNTLQGQGIGKAMVLFAEQFARDNGYHEIILNARKRAVQFYQKLDYVICSPEFTEVGIPHFSMKKAL